MKTAVESCRPVISIALLKEKSKAEVFWQKTLYPTETKVAVLIQPQKTFKRPVSLTRKCFVQWYIRKTEVWENAKLSIDFTMKLWAYLLLFQLFFFHNKSVYEKSCLKKHIYWNSVISLAPMIALRQHRKLPCVRHSRVL